MKYNHTIPETVRFHEVDLMGVCNNAVYFNYFEDARIRYIRDLKDIYGLEGVMEGASFFIMAHNEIDYFEPAFLDDALLIHTKIEFIKNSSFGFRHIVEKGDRIIAEGSGVVVHINLDTREPIPLPDSFYEAVKDYERDVEINKK